LIERFPDRLHERSKNVFGFLRSEKLRNSKEGTFAVQEWSRTLRNGTIAKSRSRFKNERITAMKSNNNSSYIMAKPL
jgi:hypothetical protein